VASSVDVAVLASYLASLRLLALLSLAIFAASRASQQAAAARRSDASISFFLLLLTASRMWIQMTSCEPTRATFNIIIVSNGDHCGPFCGSLE